MPPQESLAEASLPDDTEFLVGDDYVAGTAQIRLPDLCIATASRHDLIRTTKQLRFTPTLLASVRRMLFIGWMILTPLLLGMCEYLSRRIPGIPWDHIGMAFSGMFPILLLLTFAAGFALRESVTIEWSLKASERQRYLQRRRRTASLLIAAVAVVTILGRYVPEFADYAVPITCLLLIASLILSQIKTFQQPRPVVVGKVEGFYIIGGLSAPFLAAVHQMIERHNRDSA